MCLVQCAHVLFGCSPTSCRLDVQYQTLTVYVQHLSLWQCLDCVTAGSGKNKNPTHTFAVGDIIIFLFLLSPLCPISPTPSLPKKINHPQLFVYSTSPLLQPLRPSRVGKLPFSLSQPFTPSPRLAFHIPCKSPIPPFPLPPLPLPPSLPAALC